MADPIQETGASEHLEGSVETVVFHTEDTGYTVAKVRVPGRMEPVTVVGRVPQINVGEDLKAEGQWINDRNYGRQFRAEEIHTAAPASLDGIRKYLGSGLIDGIGKEYAARLVEHFGKDVFDVIDRESKRLEEVEGIGPKRRKQIKASWEKARAVRGIMVFLHSHGIGTGRAVRIYKTYGDEAIEILRQDPYRLARDITGIAFKTADQIAGHLGVNSDSPQRLAAGLEYTLQQAASQGHCALPEEELVRQAAEILGAIQEAVEETLRRQLGENRLESDRMEAGRLIYLPSLHRAEIVVAAGIRRLCQLPADLPDIQTEAAIAWFEKHFNQTLSAGQCEAVAEGVRRRVLVITGGPGVGKTTVMRAILAILSAKGVTPALCAPTGRAARRLAESTGMEASTIHRLLEYQPATGFARHRGRPLESAFFVMDESSMIDIQLMRQFVEALPTSAHLILVGDADQLPSVGPGSVLRDLVESGVVPVVWLTEVFRQAGASRIITAAHELNHGRMPDLAPPPGKGESDFYFIPRQTPDAILQTIEELVSHRLPQRFGFDPRKDIQVLTPMNRHLLGAESLNQRLQQLLNPPSEFTLEVERFGRNFRVGDRVIQTQNNYEKEIFNGDIGAVVEITADPVSMAVRFESGQLVRYEVGELDELRLAYAITIHKSQGSEFPAVIIPVSTQHFIMLQRNLFYTGITRGKQLVILVGDEKALRTAARNTSSRRRHGALKERLQAPERD